MTSSPYDDVTDYRLAPPVMARLIGTYLMVFAIVMLLATVGCAAAGINPNFLLVLLVVGLLGLAALAWWLRSRLSVVRLTASGYHVRMVRAAGVTEARWSEVEDAVAAEPRNVQCVVLRLRDGRSTTIPVQLLAADKDDFARDVRAHLERAAG